MKLFTLLFLLNLFIILIYLLWNYIYIKEKKGSMWMKAITMFLCPVVGPFFLFVSYWLYRAFTFVEVDISDVIFGKEKVESFVPPDEDVEKNMVSIEEALEVTDKKSLRSLMMNVIRGDYSSSLSSILLALNSEDSETAHYAASILQDVLNEFRNEINQRYEQSYIEDEHQTENCIQMIEYMYPIMKQKILTDVEQHSMAEKMEEVLNIAWEKEPNKISSSVYEKVCSLLLESEDYEKCQKWCMRLAEQYPRALSSYTCQMKLFFSCGDKENFFRVMNDLKKSDIVIDNETLEMIRTFM